MFKFRTIDAMKHVEEIIRCMGILPLQQLVHSSFASFAYGNLFM